MSYRLFLDLLIAVALVTAILVVLAGISAYAATPREYCPSNRGWMVAVGVLSLFAGANIGFIAAGLFAAGGRDE
jgi:thiamine transporter ThiT